MLNDQHIAVDVRCQGFEEYKERGAKEPEERTKFDVIHFTHSIYYLDIKESLSHCIENELNATMTSFEARKNVMQISWLHIQCAAS